MRVQTRWALALLAATSLAGLALTSTAQAQAAPPIKREVTVGTAPVNVVPDAGEADGSGVGPEARDAMGQASSAKSDVAQVMAGSLNAQYAAQQPTMILAAATPSPAPAPVAMMLAPAATAPAAATTFVAQTTPAAQIIPAVAIVSEPSVQPAVAVAPEAASSGPSVALARRVVESAEAFADYMGRASAVKPDYSDASGVVRAVNAAGVYEPVQLQEGAIAYVALVALQDPEFVRSVDALGREGYRGRLVQALGSNPRLVMQMPGSAAAAARAAKALGRMGDGLMASGSAVKQSAYDMQHSAWSKTPVATPAAMLAELKARSTMREVMALDNGQAMLGTLTQLRNVDVDGGSGKLTPVVAQGLTLAALAILGEAGEEHTDRVAALLSDATSAQCLKMARLNLYQCLSVAGPSYEDAFCLGQHAMMDTARCMSDASGWSAPARGVSVPVAASVAPAVVRPASVLVPVALGIEQSPLVNPEVAAPLMNDPAAVSLGDPNDPTPIGGSPPMGAPGGYSMQMAGAGQR